MKVGDKITWIPTEFSELSRDGKQTRLRHQGKVTGRIIAINWKHRHFTVAGVVNGYTIRETYKFRP